MFDPGQHLDYTFKNTFTVHNRERKVNVGVVCYTALILPGCM